MGQQGVGQLCMGQHGMGQHGMGQEVHGTAVNGLGVHGNQLCQLRMQEPHLEHACACDELDTDGQGRDAVDHPAAGEVRWVLVVALQACQ